MTPIFSEPARTLECGGQPARKFSAFTLIELLVVIAIIAILAAMLLPALAKAKEKALQTACVSNCKQIAIALDLYVDDNNEFFPMASDASNSNIWTKEISAYLPKKGSLATSAENQVFVCPSAQYTGLGTNSIVRTYACSGTMLGVQVNSSGLTATIPRKATQPQNSTEVILVVEGKQQAPSGTSASSCQSNFQWDEVQPDLTKPSPAKCVWLDFRHNSKLSMNVLYRDFSVRPIKFTAAGQTWTQPLWENRIKP
ncbi:MAG TPA: prepilin-type N-terminal cleavage/methylation domain-containing protein [Verrucomicrobiae bacterium]|nr:prepilin-type N-terminal cleavage/methylation domain-containing protein [Verrucomicrobiae bacterium]